jgi:hypothetical protein
MSAKGLAPRDRASGQKKGQRGRKKMLGERSCKRLERTNGGMKPTFKLLEKEVKV